MGDLVRLEDDGPGPPPPGGMQLCPSTSYQGLEVRDSSDVHVGNKYVAEQIFIVLPKDGETPRLASAPILPDSSGTPVWTFPKSKKGSFSKHKRLFKFKLKLTVLAVSFAIGLGASSLVVFALVKSGAGGDGWAGSANGTTTEAIDSFSTGPQTQSVSHSTSSKLPLSSTKAETALTREPVATLPSSPSARLTTIATSESPPTAALTSTTDVSVGTTRVGSVCATPGAENYPLVRSVVIVDVPRVTGDVCLVGGSQWGGAPCDACVPFSARGPVLELVVHFVEKCDSFDSCAGLMRRYQSDYAQRYAAPGSGFLYNFVIGGDCRLYEGLGWGQLLAGGGAARVGLQLWAGQDENEYRVSERQLYLLTLLVSVGRWCGKIGGGFAVSYVCTVKECMRFFPVQRNIRLLASDKYMMNDEAVFDEDSKALGARFSACDNFAFKHFYSVCHDINNC